MANYINNTLQRGWIKEKGKIDSKGNAFSVISYQDENGIFQDLRCKDETCTRLNINDPVCFFKSDGFWGAKILKNYGGRVVRPQDGAPYIERKSGARYQFDEELKNNVELVIFFEKQPYDAQNHTYGQAIGLIPRSFTPTSKEISEKSGIGEFTLREMLSKVPVGLFKEELTITNFQKFCAGIRVGFKSCVFEHVSSKGQTDELLAELNIRADKTIDALTNITASLYLEESAYRSLLSRFKPFFDKIIPYLYAAELGDAPSPEHLDRCFADYCGILNTVTRAKSASNPLGVTIDPDGHLYKRFAEMVRYYIFDRSISPTIQTRLAIAIALTDHADWTSDDTKKLFGGTDLEIAFEEPHQSALKELLVQTDSPLYLARYVSNALNGDASQNATDALTQEIIARFQENELEGWEIPADAEPTLLQALYKASKGSDCQFDVKLITALMILYLKCGEPCKVRFLYSHFIRHRAINALPIFSNIFRMIRKSNNKDNESANDVIYYAFTRLPAMEVYKLILWANPMFVSFWSSDFICDVGDNKQGNNVFAYFFAQLLLAPESQVKWEYINTKLLRETNHANKLMSCVCRIVLHRRFDCVPNVSAMHDTLVTLLQSNRDNRFPGLMYHVFEYIQTGKDNDDELAKMLLAYISKKNLPAHNEALPYTNEFCEFCIQKIKRNKNSTFANLLIEIKGDRLNTNEIGLVAPLASSGDFISRMLFHEYHNPNRRSDTINALLDALKNIGVGSTHAENAFYNIWSKVIFDDHTYYDFLDDDDFYTLKQACIEILENHPKTLKLKEWLNSDHSLCLKLLLCSLFVGIYHSTASVATFKNVLSDVDAKELCTDESLKNAYLSYVENAVNMQLINNTSYEDFYKYERYVKLLIARIARNGENDVQGHASVVLSLAEQNGHEELMNYFGFGECIKSLESLCSEVKTTSETCRSHLLLALLTEDTTSYFSEYPNIDLTSLKKLIRHIDYREIHKNFFLSNCQSLIDYHEDIIDNVIKQAKTLSDEMYYIFRYFQSPRKRGSISETVQTAKKIFENPSPTAAVFEVFNMDIDYTDQDFWHYVIFAKQFTEKIIGCIRNQVLGAQERSESALCRAEFALDLLNHISESPSMSYYSANAHPCYIYLSCLYNYLIGSHIPSVRAIDPNKLPKLWKNEAIRFIKQYNVQGEFKPDAILNHSFGNLSSPPEFLSLIQKIFIVRNESNDHICKNIANILQKISETQVNAPEYQNLLIELGGLIHENEQISVSFKLKVFLELLERYADSNEIKGHLENLLPELSIEDWLDPNNYNVFSAIFQSGFDKAYSFCHSIGNMSSEAEMLLKLEAVDVTAYGRNDYLDQIFKALDKKIRELKSRKLTVNYEGTYNGYAYFSVKNEGEKAIKLSSCLKADNAYIHAEVGLDTLRPGWITGFRYKVGNLSELSITISGENKDALPLYSTTHVIDDSSVGSDTSKKFYDERPLKKDETLWGRDQTIELIEKSLDVFGYAVITGPSRVGKTSIINHLTYKAEQNGDSITVIGNTDADGYNKPIGEYIKDAKNITGRNVWLIFDEFQKVINPDEKTVDEQAVIDSALMIGENDINIISQTIKQFEESTDGQRRLKIIFCGSDRFHKELSATNAVWSNILRIGNINGVDNWITVSKISKDDFKAMLRDLNGDSYYTEDALEAAALYSSQIPIYGKTICNRAIYNAQNNCIFCYDIAAAVNKMFEDKGKASRIIEPVIKGMKKRDVLLLEYLARALESNDTDTHLNKLKELCGESEVKASLQYAQQARLLLNENDVQPDFSSVFFYKVFRHMDESYTMETILEELTQDASRKVDAILDQLKDLSDDEKWDIIHKDDLFSKELSTRTIINNNYAGDYVEGNKVSVNTLNIQSVNNLFLSLREGDPARIGTSIDEFYGIDGGGNILNYLPESTRSNYIELIEYNEQNPDDALEPNEQMTKDLEIAGEKRLQTLFSCITFDDLFQLNDERWKKLLGIEDEMIPKLKNNQEFSAPLHFAVSIHNLLMMLYDKAPDIEHKEKIDFSPVALIYSKIIEETLNKLHTSLYQNHLNDPKLSCMDEIFETLYNKKPLTIGNFHYVISELRNEKEVSTCYKLLANATTNGNVAKWKLHALYLGYMLNIRNDTAHKTQSLQFEAFEKFIRVMFAGDVSLANDFASEEAEIKFKRTNRSSYIHNYKQQLSKAIWQAKNNLPKDEKTLTTGELMLIMELGGAEL